MGFPMGYTEFMIPKFFLHVIFILSYIRRFITWFFNTIGLGDLLIDNVYSSPTDTSHQTTLPWTAYAESQQHRSKKPLYASAIQEAIPVVKYNDKCGDNGEEKEEEEEDSCAVCLHEFTSGVEVRQLTNCRHVFHKCCLDPWIELDQRTCPLCRTSLLPEDLVVGVGVGVGESNLGLLSSSYFYHDEQYDDETFGFMMPSNSQTEPYSWASSTPTSPLYL
ncbi:hypothetical protein ZOSMA_38G00630 [Zostera marina]|uniref:RING-type domain-containing protein n=1 Tax=Zostera marina TaxID=29655 RepID=A0A0K9P4M1_ZOSMR|nr:hypothetical protein ZOSMA_38G00630 [Zostera marina]